MYNIIKNSDTWCAISKTDMESIVKKALETAPASVQTYSAKGVTITGSRYDSIRYTVYGTRDSRYEHAYYAVYDLETKKQVGYWEHGEVECALWIL